MDAVRFSFVFLYRADTDANFVCVWSIALEFADLLIYWIIDQLFKCHRRNEIASLINKSKVK